MAKTQSGRKLEELAYELDVRAAMSSKVITIQPECPMSEVKQLLGQNKISGLPVVQDLELLGIISIEDVIKWLSEDEHDPPVSEKMTKQVVSVFTDEPLVYAVNLLDKHGFGRLPVLERDNKKLAGILTKTDVMESLLEKLEVEYQDEELRHYRASHIFEDILADTARINFHYEISKKRIEEGGEVASSLKKTLKRLGVHPNVVRRAAIAMYEAEMNVIIYADEGRASVSIDPNGIYLEIEDDGPGIPDINKAMDPGYSTAPEWVRELGFGAGMGLPNIKMSSENMELSSNPGEGTLLKASFGMVRE